MSGKLLGVRLLSQEEKDYKLKELETLSEDVIEKLGYVTYSDELEDLVKKGKLKEQFDFVIGSEHPNYLTAMGYTVYKPLPCLQDLIDVMKEITYFIREDEYDGEDEEVFLDACYVSSVGIVYGINDNDDITCSFTSEACEGDPIQVFYRKATDTLEGCEICSDEFKVAFKKLLKWVETVSPTNVDMVHINISDLYERGEPAPKGTKYAISKYGWCTCPHRDYTWVFYNFDEYNATREEDSSYDEYEDTRVLKTLMCIDVVEETSSIIYKVAQETGGVMEKDTSIISYPSELEATKFLYSMILLSQESNKSVSIGDYVLKATPGFSKKEAENVLSTIGSLCGKRFCFTVRGVKYSYYLHNLKGTYKWLDYKANRSLSRRR